MSSPVTITLLGEPKGKGRARFVRATGVAFTPEATRSYEAALKSRATDEMGDRPPMEGALSIDVLAQFLVPVSWSERKRQAALRGEILPAKKPDADNLLKCVGDGLNKVVWRDDAQIVSASIRKRYGHQALLCVTAKPAGRQPPATNTEDSGPTGTPTGASPK
jgi:Holliday junction resolvase RusA-like endonuclease